jgi:hypothetical protein
MILSLRPARFSGWYLNIEQIHRFDDPLDGETLENWCNEALVGGSARL